MAGVSPKAAEEATRLIESPQLHKNITVNLKRGPKEFADQNAINDL